MSGHQCLIGLGGDRGAPYYVECRCGWKSAACDDITRAGAVADVHCRIENGTLETAPQLPPPRVAKRPKRTASWERDEWRSATRSASVHCYSHDMRRDGDDAMTCAMCGIHVTKEEV